MNTKNKLFIVLFCVFILSIILTILLCLKEKYFKWMIILQLMSTFISAIGLVSIHQKDNEQQQKNKDIDTNEANSILTKRENIDQNKNSVPIDSVNQITQLNGQLDQLVVISADISKGATIQTNNVVKSTDTMVEVTTAIQHIAANSEKATETSVTASNAAKAGYKLIDEMLKNMEKIHKITDQLKTFMISLATHSTKINQIANVIKDIAEQTNILSFNTRIEAARVGEQGKGFTILANEIEKLSNNSMNETKDIANVLSSIQSDVHKAANISSNCNNTALQGVSSMNKAKKYFETIIQEVNQSAEQITEIAASIQQLSAGTEEIIKTTDFTMKVQQGGTAKINKLAKLLDQFKVSFGKIGNNFQQDITEGNESNGQ